MTHGDRAQTLTSAKRPNGLHRAQYTCVSLGCVCWCWTALLFTHTTWLACHEPSRSWLDSLACASSAPHRP